MARLVVHNMGNSNKNIAVPNCVAGSYLRKSYKIKRSVFRGECSVKETPGFVEPVLGCQDSSFTPKYIFKKIGAVAD